MIEGGSVELEKQHYCSNVAKLQSQRFLRQLRQLKKMDETKEARASLLVLCGFGRGKDQSQRCENSYPVGSCTFQIDHFGQAQASRQTQEPSMGSRYTVLCSIGASEQESSDVNELFTAHLTPPITQPKRPRARGTPAEPPDGWRIVRSSPRSWSRACNCSWDHESESA